MSKDAAILRDVLARECETINHYERLAATAEQASVRELVLHLAHEEKEHVAECARLLAYLDTDYAEMLKKPLSHAIGSAAPEGDIGLFAPAPQSQTPQSAPDTTVKLAFTVGSLIER